MDSDTIALIQPDHVFCGFRLATMAETGSILATDQTGTWSFKLPACPYGLVNDCSIGVLDGRIVWIAPNRVLPSFPASVIHIDGSGKLLTPGLIDCHTHLIYAGNRADEWEARLNGTSYEQIARQGGGILSTVAATRTASLDELVRQAHFRLRRLLEEGVTTVEIKSGYGLDVASELKMLNAARRLAEQSEVTVETTLLAAHAVPPEFRNQPDRYIDLVCQEMIPAAVGLCNAVDVFCESIAFDVPQTVRVFNAAQAHGLKIKVHGEQLSHTGISVIAAEMGALSVDHLEYLTDSDCQRLASSSTVATLLPGAFYCLKESKKPPVQSLRSHGVPMGVATDCNPGSSPVTSLLLSANMACNLFGLTPVESLSAITANAARALGIQDDAGSLQPGRSADFAVWNVQSPAEIVYGLGHNPCVGSYRRGQPISRDIKTL